MEISWFKRLRGRSFFSFASIPYCQWYLPLGSAGRSILDEVPTARQGHDIELILICALKTVSGEQWIVGETEWQDSHWYIHVSPVANTSQCRRQPPQAPHQKKSGRPFWKRSAQKTTGQKDKSAQKIVRSCCSYSASSTCDTKFINEVKGVALPSFTARWLCGRILRFTMINREMDRWYRMLLTKMGLHSMHINGLAECLSNRFQKNEKRRTSRQQ